MKLSKKQREMLWGDPGPYSEANLVINIRILDDSVSRVMIEVEGNINPTTFELVTLHKDHFANDEVVTQLLATAVYESPAYGYHISAGRTEYKGTKTMKEAEARLAYMRDAIIRMHRFVMELVGEESVSWEETREILEDFPDLKKDREETKTAIKSGEYKNWVTLEEVLSKDSRSKTGGRKKRKLSE